MQSELIGDRAVTRIATKPDSPTETAPASEGANGVEAALAHAMRWARLAQPGWASLSVGTRSAALERAAKAMLRDRATVLRLAKEEMGKHGVEGLFTEALGPLQTLIDWRKLVEREQRRSVKLNPLSFPKKSARVELVPRGVVGIIAPWNYPVAGLYRSVFPALLTGNAVLVKPSEYTPRTSSWFVDHLAAEVPLGIASTIVGGPDAGAALLGAGIDACVFTGSVRSGQLVRTRCAELGIFSSVEMGGKDAAVVLADCDLARTVAGVTQWALSNSGQACGAIEVAYVEDSIADQFVAELKRAWSALRTGPGPDDIEIHPLANAKQLAHVEAHVADAVAKGALVVCGGQRTGQGLGYPATLLDRCHSRMDVVSDETFGPVLAVVRVAGVDDAVRQINASKYGLGASIWSADSDRAERIAGRLDVGITSINNHAFTGAVPALPWTGTRATGYGVANSQWSLLNFCRPKTLVVDRNQEADAYWMPFDTDLERLGDLLARAQLAELAGAWRIPLLMRRRIKRIRQFFGGGSGT